MCPTLMRAKLQARELQVLQGFPHDCWAAQARPQKVRLLERDSQGLGGQTETIPRTKY